MRKARYKMKVLIIYSSRTGVSKRCVDMLVEKLDSDAINIDIFSANQELPSPDGYDVAVIGGSVRMGAINKRIRKYLKAHADALNSINTAIFLCCGLSESVSDYVTMQIPKYIIPSLDINYFGGEVKPENAKGFDKLVLRAMRSKIKEVDFEAPDLDASPLPEIIPENIWRLADRIRGLL